MSYLCTSSLLLLGVQFLSRFKRVWWYERHKVQRKNKLNWFAGKIAGILVGVFLGLAILGAAGSYLYKKYHIQTKSLLAWRKRRRVSSAANL